ncbi:hypothetical protein BH10BAC2_BH10BAC2_18780 [soil metagenome]
MKKELLMVLFGLLLCLSANSQINESLAEKVNSVSTNLSAFSSMVDRSLVALENKDTIIRRETYKKLLDKYFTYLSYNRGALPSGNSASLDLLENETQLKFSLSQKIESKRNIKQIFIGTAGFQAKLDNGVAQLFNGQNATTGTSLFVNGAFLPSTAKFKYVLSEHDENGNPKEVSFQALNQKLRAYKDQFDEKYLKQYPVKYTILILRWLEIKNILDKGLYKCCEQKNQMPNKFDVNASDTCKCQNELLKMYVCNAESCLQKQKELVLERDGIEKLLSDAGIIDKTAKNIAEEIKQKLDTDLYKIETDLAAWQWLKFFWVSGGVIYTRETYDTYNNTLPFPDRFDQKNFDAWGIKFSLNWFKEKSQDVGLIRSKYSNISYEPLRVNSFSDIKAQAIQKNVIDSVNADTTFLYKTDKTAKDISGIKYKTSWQHSFSSAHTFMFGKNQNFGLNLLAQTRVGNLFEPVFNSRIGLLFRFVNNNFDSEDKKSSAKINLEFFIQFADMSDTQNEGKSVWQKRVIGVSTSIPFTKIFFK